MSARTGVFDSLDDGGRALAEALVADGSWRKGGPVVVAVVPNGVPAGLAAAEALGCPLVGVEPQRGDDGVVLPPLSEAERDAVASAGTVLVADDAVETGTAALAVGAALKAEGARRVVLAVPVCPRQSEAAMAGVYDAVVAPVRPLARRALTWHYPTFAPVPLEAARAAVADYEARRTAG